MTRIASLVLGLLLLGATASAQQNIVNARVETRSGASLAAAFAALPAAADPFWVGYAVPAQDPESTACCYSGRDGDACCGRCLLDESRTGGPSIRTGGTRRPIALEGPSQVTVLYRVANREVERIRTYSASCEIDAGGRTLYWLTDVPTEPSIELLLRYAGRSEGDGEGRGHLMDGAMLAIAAHRDAAADRALAALMAKDKPERVRSKAAFWAANQRGRSGFELVRTALLDASDSEAFRKRAVFAVTQSREPEALDTLMRVAKSDGSPEVRGEAIFWLGQKAGRKAAAAITDAIANDPETKVKERAVFALGQLPKDDGVPKLIEVARTNRNPAVRKQAIFWLGQTKDPRALEYFSAILAR
jgi:hypothetical protein